MRYHIGMQGGRCLDKIATCMLNSASKPSTPPHEGHKHSLICLHSLIQDGQRRVGYTTGVEIGGGELVRRHIRVEGGVRA